MLSVQIEAILFGVHRQAHAETDNQTFFTVLICLFELFLFVCLYYSRYLLVLMFALTCHHRLSRPPEMFT